jgi:fido (protein-threonine AMPylation protein)
MALIGAHTPGATPLTEEDIRGLKLASITTHGELNEAEAQNILRGQEWALRSRTRHSFPNGNGRHGRMLAHIAMVRHFGLEPLPWSGSALRDPDANRKAYIDALVAEDHRDLAPLLAFARSDGS